MGSSPNQIKLFFLLFVLSLLMITSLTIVVFAVGGVEFNLIYTHPSPDYFGSIGIYVVPLNVSDVSLLQQASLYVIDSAGLPRYSYLFSSIPPLVLFLEQSLGITTYSIYYGGTNPYTGFIATPGTPQSIWGAFDDFDYNTGFWSTYNSILGGGKYEVGSGGWLALNTSYPQDFLHIFTVLGRRALKIVLNVTEGWVIIHLTEKEFGDWEVIFDGKDIYFIHQDGTPLRYSIIYFNKREKTLISAVELKGSNTVLMMYGGANPYENYRVE